MSAPESIITQVQPPAADNGDDGPAGIIASVKPTSDVGGQPATTKAGPPTSSTPAPITTQPSTPTPPSPTAPGAPTSASLRSGASSTRSSARSSWKSFLGSIFSCCYPGIAHSEVDVEKEKKDGLPMTATTGKGLDKGGGTVAASEKGKDTKVVVKQSGPTPATKTKQPEPETRYLLKPLAPEDVGRKCLVLDLDETLVHSSFKAVPQADFIIPVEIDGQVHNVYVLKRPGVDVFLERLGRQFEVVVFTASLSKYADPVLDKLDRHRVVKHRLFREACLHHKGNYVKDLSMLGRDLKDVIILDNSPASYIFHPTNAIPISSWFNDPNDTELLDLIPFLEDLKLVDDVTMVLDNSNEE